jgi:hypothetical protein
VTHYPIVIQASYLATPWIKSFLSAIARAGGDIRQIAHFDLFNTELQQNPDQSSRMMKESAIRAHHLIYPLLHPRYHKHYLGAIASLHPQLQDSRSLLVYDLDHIPDTCGNEEKLNVVTVIGVRSVIDLLESRNVRRERMMNRTDAIDAIAKFIPLPS